MNKVSLNKVIDLNKNLVEYVKNNQSGTTRKQAIGILVSTLVDNEIRVGWSKCNLKSGDIFNISYGVNKALGRARVNEFQIDYSKVPAGLMRNQYRKFVARSRRYFKNCNINFASNFTKETN